MYFAAAVSVRDPVAVPDLEHIIAIPGSAGRCIKGFGLCVCREETQERNGGGAVCSPPSVIHILETVKVKQMPRSVLSVCTVSQAENRKDSACRMVELRTPSGVGNSKATEAVSRLSWGGCSIRQAGGTSRAIFRVASRRAVNRDMAVGSIIFTANTPQ